MLLLQMGKKNLVKNIENHEKYQRTELISKEELYTERRQLLTRNPFWSLSYTTQELHLKLINVKNQVEM